MNKIVKQKKLLKILCLVVGICSALAIAGGVVMIVFGSNAIIAEGIAKAKPWLLIGFGSILTILGIIFLLWSIFWAFVGTGSKYKDGNVADDNFLKSAGTVNMNKCPNCGCEIKEGETFCGKCGHPVIGDKVCPSCGAKNNKDTAYCVSCGKKL